MRGNARDGCDVSRLSKIAVWRHAVIVAKYLRYFRYEHPRDTRIRSVIHRHRHKIGRRIPRARPMGDEVEFAGHRVRNAGAIDWAVAGKDFVTPGQRTGTAVGPAGPVGKVEARLGDRPAVQLPPSSCR